MLGGGRSGKKEKNMNDKKTPNDYPQVKFRPGTGSNLESALIERVELQSDSTFSQVAKRDLERYYAGLPSALPSFSEREAIWLVDAFNGSRNVNPDRIYLEVLAFFEEDLTPEQKKLVNFLRNLPTYASVAVLDAVERYWQGGYSKTPEQSQRRLREVGLVK